MTQASRSSEPTFAVTFLSWFASFEFDCDTNLPRSMLRIGTQTNKETL
jgi:hypothetical protein